MSRSEGPADSRFRIAASNDLESRCDNGAYRGQMSRSAADACFAGLRITGEMRGHYKRSQIPDRSWLPLQPSVRGNPFLIGLRVLCGLLCICRCTFFGHATPDRAGARPYRVQCRVARCDMGLPAHTSHPLSRLLRACIPSRALETQFLIGLRFLCYLLFKSSLSSSLPSV